MTLNELQTALYVLRQDYENRGYKDVGESTVWITDAETGGAQFKLFRVEIDNWDGDLQTLLSPT